MKRLSGDSAVWQGGGCACSVLLVLAVIALTGCWGPGSPWPGTPEGRPTWAGQTPGSPAPSPGRMGQSPASPRKRPAQSPVSPKPTPEPVPAPKPVEIETPAVEEDPGPEYGFTLAQLNDVQEGMSLDQVAKIVGQPGITVSGNIANSVVHRWDAEGGSFLAKFTNGKLTRKMLVGGAESSEPPGEDTALSREQYNAIHEGMSLGEVLALLEVEAQAVSDSESGVAIYRWSDSKGSNFTARFEKGRLVRKTGFHVVPMEKSADAVRRDTVAGPGEEEEALEREVFERQAMAPSEARGRRAASEDGEYPSGQDAGGAAEEEPRVKTLTPAPLSRVTVAGSARRAREAETDPSPHAGRSYKPKAKLPDYTYSLRRGVYEIRINNPADAPVTAGVRAGKRGRDVSIGPGGHDSVYVDRGNYQLYFIYKDDPYTVHQGQTVRIDGTPLGDVEIYLFSEG